MIILNAVPSRLEYLGYTLNDDGSIVKETVKIAKPEDIGPGRYNRLIILIILHFTL